MVTSSSILAWRIPGTKEPGGGGGAWLQSMGSQDITERLTLLSLFTKSMILTGLTDLAGYLSKWINSIQNHLYKIIHSKNSSYFKYSSFSQEPKRERQWAMNRPASAPGHIPECLNCFFIHIHNTHMETEKVVCQTASSCSVKKSSHKGKTTCLYIWKSKVDCWWRGSGGGGGRRLRTWDKSPGLG